MSLQTLRLRWIIVLFCSSSAIALEPADNSADTTPSPIARIAFGSCNKEDHPQPLWDVIIKNKPDLWIWLGDNIYANTENMVNMVKKYRTQKWNPGYRRLLAFCPIIGTWDDHDYGLNNGGKEFVARTTSQKIFLDFLDEPTDSQRRQRQGVYASYVYGLPPKQVKVILLDTRFHRDTPGPGSDILGVQQWEWLQQELQQSTAQLHIIGSSIQVLAAEHPYEKWSNFPTSRKRLLELLKKVAAPGMLLISGDRHIGEISRYDSLGRNIPLYEITSSGLTHSYNGIPTESNRLRIGKIIHQKNFGLIEIDWTKNSVEISMQVRNEENAIMTAAKLQLN